MDSEKVWTKVTPTNGIAAELRFINEQLQRLWREKATNERVDSIHEDISELKVAIDKCSASTEALRASFNDLMKGILIACVVWSLGVAGFIIAVFQVFQ